MPAILELAAGFLAPGDLLQSDVVKVLVLVLAALGLFAFARWASAASGSETPLSPPGEIPPEVQVSSAPDPLEVLDSFPPDPTLGAIQITKFYFSKMDAVPGPPDPYAFADELLVELYDGDSDRTWTQSFYVASPQGLTTVLQERSWGYLYAPEILVLPRYDLQEIRRAVISRIVEERDFFKSGRDNTAGEEPL